MSGSETGFEAAEEQVDRFLQVMVLERGLSPNTVSAYMTDLRQAFGEIPGMPFPDPGDLSEWIAGLSAKGMTPRTIRRKVSSIRAFFRFMTEEEGIAADPCRFLRSPRLNADLPDHLAVSEVEALLEAVPAATPLGIRNRALLELAYGSGLRESELVTLTLDRLNLEEGFVRPLGKGSRERLVPMGGPSVEWMKRYLSEARPSRARRGSGRVVLLSRTGKPLSRMTVWSVVKTSALAAGLLHRVHPHTLRHSFATHLLAGGADLRVVQELLGHADIRTTEIYTSVDRTRLSSVVEKYHPRGRG